MTANQGEAAVMPSEFPEDSAENVPAGFFGIQVHPASSRDSALSAAPNPPEEPGPGRTLSPVPAPAPPPSPAPTNTDEEDPPGLRIAELAPAEKPTPRSGWRRALHRMTGGVLNPGPSRADRQHEAIREQIRYRVNDTWWVTIANLKGGAGKTTVAAMLGLTLAELRSDQVAAMDLNPNKGTLGERLTAVGQHTARHLLAQHRRAPLTPKQMQNFMAYVGDLHVLSNEQSPEVSQDFGADEFRALAELLNTSYAVVLADTGNSPLQDAFQALLEVTDTIIVVAGPALDTATRAEGTLQWLWTHGYDDLVSRAVLVLNKPRRTSWLARCSSRQARRDFRQHRAVLRRLYYRFKPYVQDIVAIPYDPALDNGGVIDSARVSTATRAAYQQLAATVTSRFATGY